MTREEILIKLKEIFKLVSSNGVNLDNVDENTNIMLDLGVNSIGIIYLAVAVEQTFGIDMSQASINSFKTIKDVIDYIEQKQ